MRKRELSFLITVCMVFMIISCRPKVTCPNPKQEANKLFENAGKGKSTLKPKTNNGLIKKKNPNKRKKR